QVKEAIAVVVSDADAGGERTDGVVDLGLERAVAIAEHYVDAGGEAVGGDQVEKAIAVQINGSNSADGLGLAIEEDAGLVGAIAVAEQESDFVEIADGNIELAIAVKVGSHDRAWRGTAAGSQLRPEGTVAPAHQGADGVVAISDDHIELAIRVQIA